MDATTVQNCGIAILLLPLLGAVMAGALGPRILKGASHWPVVLGVAGAMLASFTILAQTLSAGHESSTLSLLIYEWIPSGLHSWFNVEFLVDPLTAVMLVTVTSVALLVIIYSRDYMRSHDHPERGYERFFCFLGIFVFSMCALVLAGNFLLLYLGWELVGLCSYLLIGFYYQKPSAAAAAKKAFLVNRVGDFGFGLGILLIYLTIGHLDYHTVFAAVAARHDPQQLATLLQLDLGSAAQVAATIQDRVAIIALLLFCGAIGKSAQLPLHVWLPDAMEGPSPVSALIHAATMVTAGVYMVARCGEIFTASPAVMAFVAGLGAATALFAATIALVQHDMKRILAYSTMSQLGYMFMGLGVYAAGSAVFHLFTHAFFKALLFLGAGSVMHAMGGIIDLRYFSGLKRVLPWTYRTFLVGSLALAGFPLLAGFWSKDEIIHAAFQQSTLLGTIGLLTALLTTFYTFRMLFRAFAGPTKLPEGVHAHESGKWMLVPLVILSVGAVFAGYLGVHFAGGGFFGVFAAHGPFHHFLAPVFASTFLTHSAHGGEQGYLAEYGLMYLSVLTVPLAIGLAYQLYVRRPWMALLLRDAGRRPYELLSQKYFVDELYHALIVRPLWTFGEVCFAIDRFFIDGLIWLVIGVPRGLAWMFRGLQAGSLQGYGVTMAAGLAILAVWLLWA